MPIALHPLQKIVNVSWGGLAVEFENNASYLNLGKLDSFSMNKVVISFWFRIPQASIDHAQNMPSGTSGGGFWGHRVFLSVIPLITWGKQVEVPVSDIEDVDTGAVSFVGPIFVQKITGLHHEPVQPSCIGVRVGSRDHPWDPPVLDVHIQTNVKAKGTGLLTMASSFTGNYVGTVETPGSPYLGRPLYVNVEYVLEDVSNTVYEEPEYLGNSDSSSSGSDNNHPEIGQPDEWHHLLISWELKSHSNMDGACKMWCAIDNQDKNGADLPAMTDPNVMGPNDHMSVTPFTYRDQAAASASVSFGDSNIPTNPADVPGPASAQYATNPDGGESSFSPIEMVELADLQIFSGVTLDTSKDSNRRAFIDFERDQDGNQLGTDLKPVNPKKAEELLSQKPDILLRGSSNWISGKNTGSLGVDADGKPIPEGQFQPNGKIKSYKPDPSIKLS